MLRPNGQRPSLILHLRDTHEVGGPGKTILETHRAIDPMRFSLHLAVFLSRGESGDTPFAKAAEEYGLPVHIIRGRSQYDPRLVWRLARLIETLNVDILHSHDVRSDVLAYLASGLRSVPIVTTLHGWIGNTAKRRFMNRLDRRLVRRFDAVIAVSERMRAELIGAGADPNRTLLLHNAIVFERYRRTGRGGRLSELLGTTPQKPVVGCIGRLSPEKGQVDLLEALRILATGGRRVSTVFAGDGPDRRVLTDRVHALALDGFVYFLGHVARPQEILEDIDLLVLPSHTEGLPNSALEALAMDVPVLATRVGGTPEVVQDGLSGRLVPARSPNALAAGMLDFLGHREAWSQMAKRGRELVEAEFGFTNRTRKLEAVYGDLLSRSA